MSPLLFTPLSLTMILPRGTSGASRSVTARSVLKVRRSRLLMPMISAPAANAVSNSPGSWTSTRHCIHMLMLRASNSLS